MKVLIYTSNVKDLEKSGVGKASAHQKEALDLVHIPYTTNPKDDYDIAHINTIFPDALLVAKRAKAKGKKVIFHAHSTEEDFRNSFKLSNALAPAFKEWIKTCYKQGDLILTPTPYSKKLIESYGIKKEIIPISNGIDLKYFKKTKEAGERFRNKYGFSKNDKVIMAVGLYIERKGILEFLELAKRMPFYKFIWFGHTDPALVTLKVKEAMKNKTDNVYFPGYVQSLELKDAYSGADIFIFPTKEETEGIVLLEALAMKIDTVISDIPIYEEWLTDGVNVYKAKSVDEFEEKIKDILNKKLPSLTFQGYQVAAEKDLSKIALELKNIYEKVLENDLVK
ncbi:MAG: glycosyltransferase [Bacilli bacterium]|nr:glycosyltransferase [Bacilli bacterium]